MNRIRNLTRYQKIVLLILAFMFVLFTAVYFAVTSRVGYDYKGAILVPREENGSVVYSGRVHGTDTEITVTPEKSVIFRHGAAIYGPYTVREDPSAAPVDSEFSEYMIGIEIRQGESVFFRGGMLKTEAWTSDWMLFDEDGGMHGLTFTYSTGDGIERDPDGNPVDRFAPDAYAILELVEGPKLTNQGHWLGWFGGAFLSALTAVLMLFADELFRWQLSFRIRYAGDAEPSDWEIAGRYVSWTLLSVLALATYVLGLTMV